MMSHFSVIRPRSSKIAPSRLCTGRFQGQCKHHILNKPVSCRTFSRLVSQQTRSLSVCPKSMLHINQNYIIKRLMSDEKKNWGKEFTTAFGEVMKRMNLTALGIAGILMIWYLYDKRANEFDFDESDNRVETDIEPQFTVQSRSGNPDLPNTVTVLDTAWGTKVYLVGILHDIEKSKQDIAEVIQMTQPNVVMVQLCRVRVDSFEWHEDEETSLLETKNTDLNEKIMLYRQKNGFRQALLYQKLLREKAYDNQCGEEFKTAYDEARKIHGCHFYLGDRPLRISSDRIIASLSLWHLLTFRFYIREKVMEKFKQEMAIYWSNSLKSVALPSQCYGEPHGFQPKTVVAVVPMIDVPWIIKYWQKKKPHLKEIKRTITWYHESGPTEYYYRSEDKY